MKPIIILLIIFFVVRYIRKRYVMGSRHDTVGARGRVREKAGEEMVFDPVCNSYISLSSAVIARTEGGVEYFCSNECREKFLERA